MKKIIKLILISILLTNIIEAKTIQIANPGADQDIQPNLQTAVNDAVNGDIIEIPAGQFIINKNVLITKFISFKGQGIGKTILYRSETTPDATLSYDSDWQAIFRFTINSTVSSGIVVSDITFKSKKPSLVDGDGLSLAEDEGVEMVNCLDFVITRCRFENFGNGAVSVYHDDDIARGLINKNEFVHNCKGYDALGLGYGVVVYGANKKWIADPKFGSSNFIFVEDNTFDYHRHSIAAGGCALYVFRYNTVKNNIAGNTAHAIDAHEARLEGVENYYSSRAIEVYNNSIINTMFRDGTTNCPNGTTIVAGQDPAWLTECAIRTRGGESVIHDNYIEGYRFGVGLVSPSVNSNTTYPNPYQQGYLSGVKYGVSHTGVDNDKADGDVFIWNDNYKSYAPTNSKCVYFYNYTPSFLVAERDYHLFSKANYTPYTYPHPLSNNTVPTTITLTVASVNITCNGATNGSATVSATGGTGNYSYSWNSVPVQTTANATNLAAGTYTITVTDGAGIVKTAMVTITEPTALSLTVSHTSEYCSKKNGTATVTVSGGITPYAYSWSTTPIQTTNVASNLVAGTYTIKVSDKNGCSKTATTTVKNVRGPSAAITSKDVSCNSTANGSALVDVTDGTAPFTYEWNTVPAQLSNQLVNVKPGSYEVTVADAKGCSTKKTVSILKSEATFGLSTQKTNASCATCSDGTATVIVSGQPATYSYVWSAKWNTALTTNSSATGLSVGNYSITVTDNNGCSKQAMTDIGVSISTGINSANAEKSDITLFPSPTQSKFAIQNGGFTANESVLVVLYNTAGVEVYSKVIIKAGDVIAVDTENKLEPGIYIVVASSEDHYYKKKLIITK